MEIKMSNVLPVIQLPNGVQMPRLMFGVYQIQDPKLCQKAVEDALECGYRAIDTAASYGNEAAVGAAIRASGLPSLTVSEPSI
jgi:2,5-diketo-D-gluconate reductase A